MPKRNPVNHVPYQPVDASFFKALPTMATPVRPTIVPPPAEPERPPPADTPKLELTKGETVAEIRSNDIAVEPLDQPVKFRVTRTEAAELRRMAGIVGEHLRCPVDVANLGRAFLILLRHAEGEVRQESRRLGPTKRPRNDNMAALAEFDHKIAGILAQAFRKVGPFR